MSSQMEEALNCNLFPCKLVRQAPKPVQRWRLRMTTRLDAAVHDALGLTSGERQAAPAGGAELVNNRKRRARSAGGGAA